MIKGLILDFPIFLLMCLPGALLLGLDLYVVCCDTDADCLLMFTIVRVRKVQGL